MDSRKQHALHRTLQLGRAHLQNHELEKAIDSFQKIIKWLPTDLHANLQLAYIYLHKGDFERALGHINTSLSTKPRNLFAWAQRIAILQQLDDESELTVAQTELQELDLPLDKIFEISKSVLVPPHKRIEFLIEILNKKNLINTEIAARLFIENYPDHPLGWQVLGEVLHDSGQFDEALEIKRKTANKFPKDANAYNNLARTLLALQDYEGTKVQARKALQIDPNHKNASYHLMRANVSTTRSHNNSKNHEENKIQQRKVHSSSPKKAIFERFDRVGK